MLDLAVDAAVDADLTTLPPALARLVLQRMAGDVPIGAHADAILALARKGGTASLDLPGGLRATSEYGRVTIARRRVVEPPAPATLTVPGETRFGDGVVTCEVGEGDLAGLAPTLEVRAWRPGDRMRPAGLGGTKSLQDLFTDRKVPRARRHDAARRALRRRDRVDPGRGHRRALPRHGRVRRPCPLRLAALMSEEIGEILVQADDLQHRIRAMAEDIARDYQGQDLLLIGVLKGAFLFLADLMRHLDVGCEVDFMAVASYGSSRSPAASCGSSRTSSSRSRAATS